MHEYLYTHSTNVFFVITVTCDECTEAKTAGSLSYGNTVADNKTYILADSKYEIPSNGSVIGWEFCYQTSVIAPVTFYPGIWNITDMKKNGDTDYKLIRASTITYDPRNVTNPFSCVRINLSEKDRITVSMGLVAIVGLFSNTESLLLRTTTHDPLTAYECEGNQTMVMNVRPNRNNEDVDFNIAIRAIIGEYQQ